MPIIAVVLLIMPSILAQGSILDDGSTDQTQNRAGIVIDYGDGRVDSLCIDFTEEELTGYDILLRTEIPVEFDFQSGGQAVCKVDEIGCGTGDCFCACPGGDKCVYWTYWHLIDGDWQYSVSGAGTFAVRDGMVEGWRWGSGSPTGAAAEKPALRSFDEICASNREIPASTSEGVSPTLTPAMDEKQALTSSGSSYAFFGILLVGLIGIGWVVLRRSNRAG
jgi:hypothetical protein